MNSYAISWILRGLLLSLGVVLLVGSNAERLLVGGLKVVSGVQVQPAPVANRAPAAQDRVYVDPKSLDFKIDPQTKKVVAIVWKKKSPLASVAVRKFAKLTLPSKSLHPDAFSDLRHMKSLRNSALAAHKKVMICLSCGDSIRVSQLPDQ